MAAPLELFSWLLEDSRDIAEIPETHYWVAVSIVYWLDTTAFRSNAWRVLDRPENFTIERFKEEAALTIVMENSAGLIKTHPELARAAVEKYEILFCVPLRYAVHTARVVLKTETQR
jgi:hypothetical protein